MRNLALTVLLILLSNLGCTRQRAELGTAENPVKFFLLPSVEHAVLEASGRAIKNYLEAHTPYKFHVSVPTNYITVVEAFGSKRADIASLNTFGYMLAHQKFQTEALLTVIRNQDSSYQSAVIASEKSGIRKLEDINGKRFAYVDPTSTSGYILPAKLLKDNKVKPKETVFAQRHDNVISMIYQGQVDAGAIYYSPPINGEVQDARRLVLSQYPDVAEKIKIVALSAKIPNDAIVFRKDLPQPIKNAVVEGLIAFVATAEGKAALEKTFTVTGFKRATDDDYNSARQMFSEMGIDLESLLRK